MNTILSPLRRVGAGLLIAGIAAFGTVAVAPAALADETVAVAVAPVAEPTAPVVTEPAAKPGKTPKICTAEDLEAFAAQSLKWQQQAEQLQSLAVKARAGAEALRAQSKNLRAAAKKFAEELAKALDKAAAAWEAQAQDLIAKTLLGPPCTVPGAARF
ncbi:MAG: hypothetical protein JWQ45_1598 [Blastococcus sp.]|jgi:hypothetical protein|nr:hypothetical protein [Blastococcus sp.]